MSITHKLNDINNLSQTSLQEDTSDSSEVVLFAVSVVLLARLSLG